MTFECFVNLVNLLTVRCKGKVGLDLTSIREYHLGNQVSFTVKILIINKVIGNITRVQKNEGIKI